MKLKEYYEHLAKMIEENEELLDYDVVYEDQYCTYSILDEPYVIECNKEVVVN